MTLIEKGKLLAAINNIDELRESYKVLNKPQEAELLYQIKQLVGELNQYIEGGYLSPDYIEEKCDSIKHRAVEIWESNFNK